MRRAQPPAPLAVRSKEAPLGELRPVAERARTYVQNASASSTRRVYRTQWEAFASWCESHHLAALPAEDDTVALYLTTLAEEGLSASTMDVVLAAISKAHELAGHRSPRFSPTVRTVRSGIRRTIGTAQRQVTPLVIGYLRRALAPLGESLIDVRDRALLLVGFAGAFRRSELVSLNADDVREVEGGLEILLRRSKTDQESEGRLLGIPRGAHSTTCPVRAVGAWLKASGIQREALFVGVNRWGKPTGLRLCDRDVARIIKRRAAAVGLDPEQLSGHSLRAGFATTAARAGKPDSLIMQQTGHKNPQVFLRYVRRVKLFEENAADGIGL